MDFNAFLDLYRLTCTKPWWKSVTIYFNVAIVGLIVVLETVVKNQTELQLSAETLTWIVALAAVGNTILRFKTVAPVALRPPTATVVENAINTMSDQ